MFTAEQLYINSNNYFAKSNKISGFEPIGVSLRRQAFNEKNKNIEYIESVLFFSNFFNLVLFLISHMINVVKKFLYIQMENIYIQTYI